MRVLVPRCLELSFELLNAQVTPPELLVKDQHGPPVILFSLDEAVHEVVTSELAGVLDALILFLLLPQLVLKCLYTLCCFLGLAEVV